MKLSKRDAQRLFTKLELEHKRSTGHVYGWLVVDGKRVLPMHYSHGRGDMPGHVPDRFRKAMHLDRDEFGLMVGCTMTRRAYVDLLREKGIC